jgi:UrcA family protein
MIKLTKILAFGAFGLAIATLPAQGADKTITRTAVVKYADLNLAKTAGARALYSRIEGAAARLCGPVNVGAVGAWRDYHTCIRDAVGDAVSRVNSPMLSDLHRDHTRLASKPG